VHVDAWHGQQRRRRPEPASRWPDEITHDVADRSASGVRHRADEPIAQEPQHRLDPGLPPKARPHADGRPTSTAAAPSASAITTSAPSRIPPSTSTGTRPAAASTTPGSASRVAGARSSWRPPWLETTIASAPCSIAARASSSRTIPFTITGSDGACARIQARSSHERFGSNSCGDPAGPTGSA